MTVLALLRSWSWQELRQHPWRHGAAVVAVMLGVALAFSVHLINASALAEFSQAARAAGGQPDLSLRAPRGALPEALYPDIARLPGVTQASPVLELATQALAPDGRIALQVLGIDALRVASVAPELMPRASPDAPRLALFAPATVFLNPSARQRLSGEQLQLLVGSELVNVRVAA